MSNKTFLYIFCTEDETALLSWYETNNNDNANREIGVDRRGLRLQAGCHTDCVDK